MASDDELERKVAELRHNHDMTRWWTGRVDRDIAQLGATQTEHGRKLDQLATTQQRHTEILQEHTARFDSLDAQMRSLTQLVGQVLERLPEKPHAGEDVDPQEKRPDQPG